MQALDPDNKLASLRVDASGKLLTAGGSAGLPAGASTEAKQDVGNTSLASINTKVTGLATQTTLAAILALLPTALLNNRLQVEPLGASGGIARQLAAGVSSTNVALTTTTRRISLYARGADIRYSIGSSAQTATTSTGVATSHFLAAGERIELVVPATPNVAAIRAGSTDGTLEITELL